MRRMRIIVLLCACILLCACPKQPIQRYITLVNKSGKEIVCQQLWCATITNADTLYECRIPTQGILAWIPSVYTVFGIGCREVP